MAGWQKIDITRGAAKNRREKEEKDVRDAHSTGERENVHQRNASQPLKRRMVNTRGSDDVANG
jgi:hypothetical protein